jgi:hypothetical protein
MSLHGRPRPPPDGTKALLCCHLEARSYDTDTLFGVLEQLNGFYDGQQVELANWRQRAIRSPNRPGRAFSVSATATA